MSLEAQLSATNRAASTAIEASLPKAPKAKPTPKPKPEPKAKTEPEAKAAEPKQDDKPKPEAKATRPAKKAAPAKAEAKPGRSPYAPDAVITVKSTEHGKRGNRAMVLDVMKSGITIAKYKEALKKIKHPGMATWALNYAAENKLISVK